MFSKLKGFWYVFALILISIFLFIITSYKKDSVRISPSFQTSTMKDLFLTHREKNQIKWELSASKAEFPAGNRQIFLDTIGLAINNSPKIFLTSGKGIYEIETEDIELYSTVELKVKDSVFKTDSMHWDSKQEMITADNEVNFTGNSFNIYGKGLLAKTNQQTVKVMNNVKAVFYN